LVGTHWEHNKRTAYEQGNFKHNWNIIKNHGELCGNSLRTARLENSHFTVFPFSERQKISEIWMKCLWCSWTGDDP
jgi:hypothetical protein